MHLSSTLIQGLRNRLHLKIAPTGFIGNHKNRMVFGTNSNFEIWERKLKTERFSWKSDDFLVYQMFLFKIQILNEKDKSTCFYDLSLDFLVFGFSKFLKTWTFWIVTDRFLMNRRNRTGMVLLIFTITQSGFHRYLNTCF